MVLSFLSLSKAPLFLLSLIFPRQNLSHSCCYLCNLPWVFLSSENYNLQENAAKQHILRKIWTSFNSFLHENRYALDWDCCDISCKTFIELPILRCILIITLSSLTSKIAGQDEPFSSVIMYILYFVVEKVLKLNGFDFFSY